MTYHVLDRGQWILNTYGGHLGGYPDINGVDTLVEQENLVLDIQYEKMPTGGFRVSGNIQQ